MWITKSNATMLVSYLQCSSRYLHHAIRDESSWIDLRAEYRIRHRPLLVQTINELCKAQNNVNPYSPESQDQVLMHGIPEKRRITFTSDFHAFCMAPRLMAKLCCNFICNIPKAYWIDATFVNRACNSIAMFDNAFIKESLGNVSMLIKIRASLGRIRSEIGRELIGAFCHDNGDFWPTDSGEKFATDNHKFWLLDSESRWRFNKINYPTDDSCSIGSCEINPLCIDRIKIHATVENRHMRDLHYSGEGCLIGRSCAAALCKYVTDRPINEVPSDIFYLAELGLPLISVNRRRCAQVSLLSLQGLVAKYLA